VLQAGIDISQEKCTFQIFSLSLFETVEIPCEPWYGDFSILIAKVYQERPEFMHRLPSILDLAFFPSINRPKDYAIRNALSPLLA
jgi:hypothetical protein